MCLRPLMLSGKTASVLLLFLPGGLFAEERPVADQKPLQLQALVPLSGPDTLKEVMETARKVNEDARTVADILTAWTPEEKEPDDPTTAAGNDGPNRLPYVMRQMRRIVPMPQNRLPLVPDTAASLVRDGDAYRVLTAAARAYQIKLAVIANNLANADTTAFKRSRVVFEDLSYRHELMPGVEDSSGRYSATGISVGLGVRVAAIQTDFRQGAFKQTGRKLDVAIEGRGFFKVVDPSTSEILYTRAGNFSQNCNGELVTGLAGTGRLLDPPIVIPADVTEIAISPQGRVAIRQPGTIPLVPVGEIELATFLNAEGLLKLGENLYAETDASGPPTVGSPADSGFGLLRQSTLETSNVETQQELIQWGQTLRRLQLVWRLMQIE